MSKTIKSSGIFFNRLAEQDGTTVEEALNHHCHIIQSESAITSIGTTVLVYILQIIERLNE